MREYSLNATQSLDAVLSPRHAQRLCAARQTRVLDAGEFLCHQGDDARDASLIALQRSHVVLIAPDAMLQLLRTDGDCAVHVIRLVLDRSR